MSLRKTITALAEEFSLGILAAIRSASLEELLSESGRGTGAASTGRRPGRPPAAARSNGAAAQAAEAPPSKGTGQGKKRRGGRLARRSPEQIGKVVESVVVALRKSKNGMRSEQLQKMLGLDKKEITGPLVQALAGKKIRKTGQKRATTYFAR